MFQERYIQNPGTFRTRSIFRTRCILRTLSKIYDGMFCKTQLPSELSGLSPQTFSQNFFLKIPALKKFIYFFKIFFLIFKKLNFLIFKKRYIQNPGIFTIISPFRTGDIFSDCKTSKVEHFLQTATSRTFTSKLKK